VNEAIHNDDPIVLAATSADVCAAEWLQKQRFWAWADEDQIALDAWLAESPAHQVAYWRLDAAWDRTQRLVALGPAMREPQKGSGRKSIWPFFAGLAASAAIAVMLGAGVYLYNSRPSDKIFSTPVGGREIVTLADGSQIELNTNTELRANVRDGVRTVTLVRGEAYFQIVHDPKRPFVVATSDGRILDLGTKFLVRKDAGKLEVALLDGRVRFEPVGLQASRDNQAMLRPGDVIHATPVSISMTKEPIEALQRQLSWRKGVLVFDHATVAAAVTEFNRYNDEKLIVADAQTGALTFSSAFPINGTEAFVRLAQQTLDLHAERRGEAIVISR
jgi:transmembrane sensor